MTAFLIWFQFALQAMPTVLQLILAAEAAIGVGNGAAKKSLVVQTVTAAGAASGASAANVALATGIVGSLVDTTVAGLNSAGVLSSAAPVVH